MMVILISMVTEGQQTRLQINYFDEVHCIKGISKNSSHFG